MADVFIPRPDIGRQNCADGSPKGKPSYKFDYALKSLTGDDVYPPEACIPYLHYNLLVENLRANAQIVAPKFQGTFYGKLIGTATGNKSFDIKHPTKSNWRLRHTCLEGPENAVFYRGRLKDNNIIELPEYWMGLVDPESITISLTQIGYSQDLIVEKIEWGRKVIIKSGNGANVDCYYLIHATRKDTEDLIPEYEGETPADYPGNNDYYSVAGYNYDVRNGDINL